MSGSVARRRRRRNPCGHAVDRARLNRFCEEREPEISRALSDARDDEAVLVETERVVVVDRSDLLRQMQSWFLEHPPCIRALEARAPDGARWLVTIAGDLVSVAAARPVGRMRGAA